MELEDVLRLGLDEFLHIRTVHLSDIDRTGRINSNRRRIAEARHLVEDPAFFEAHHEQAVVVAAVDQIHQIAFDKETPRHADVRPLIQELAVFVENLHAGDADYYTQFRVPKAGPATVVVRPTHASGNYALYLNRWPRTGLVKSGPARRWQDAVKIPLGQTVFASGDDENYVPLPGTTRRTPATRAASTDWYEFEFTSGTPKLVFFQVDLMERDQIPVDVAVYRLVNGEPHEYFDGEDPVTLPHEAQALTGHVLRGRASGPSGVQATNPRVRSAAIHGSADGRAHRARLRPCRR